jgi:hypothetical protein
MLRERTARGGDATFGGPDIRRFELTEALSSGGSAAAVFVLFRGSGYVATVIALTVYDFEGGKSGSSGQRGRAVWCPDARRWEIIQLEC